MTRLRCPRIDQKPDAQEPGSPGWLAWAVVLCFLVSGGTSLVLEATLSRLLRFALGNTTLAVTTVLCAFMAGLALGSYFGGRLCERTRRLLRTYGLLEGAVGVFCLLLPALIEALEPLDRVMYASLQDRPAVLSLGRFLLCGVLLLIPSTFMGATLPILTRWWSLGQGPVGRSVAGLYAINSAGAGAGVLLCGFLLLPELGVTWTLRLACGAAILICLLTVMLDRRYERNVQAQASSGDGPRGPKTRDVLSRGWRVGLLLAYGLSGAAALVYEVAWTRALALVIGSTTYAFSLMLAAFIIGLAIGSATIMRLADRLRSPLGMFAGVELAIGASAMATLPLFGWMPEWIAEIVQRHSGSFAAMQGIEFGLIVLVMIVPTTLMGAAFPLLVRTLAGGARPAAQRVGDLYAANTTGGIFGAFLASFWLIPAMGTQTTVLAAAGVNLLIGAAVLWRLSAGGRIRLGVAGAAALLGLSAPFWFPSWDPSVMTSGAYLYGVQAGGASATGTDAGRLVFHREDMCTAVTVREHASGVRSLAVGGKVDASTGEDLPTQLFLAHAPLLMHSGPKSACVIGLASGMTAGATLRYDLDRLDCVEISPAVVKASHFFDDVNGQPLSDARTRLIIADGRNHLARTDDTYDVIISEPSNPWIAGVGDLFTEEFFETCRRRLAPRGLACVWLQAYQIDEPLFRSVVGTFSRVFPHMIVFESRPLGDYLLIGSGEPMGVAPGALAARLAAPKVAKDLGRIGVETPADFLRCIVMSRGIGEYVQQPVLHTDDNALLEFAAPRSLYRQDAGLALVQRLNGHRRFDGDFVQEDPAEPGAAAGLRQDLARLVEAQRLAMDAVLLQRRGQLGEAHALAARAAKLDPTGPELLNGVAESILAEAAARLRQGDRDRALFYCGQAANLAPNLYIAHETFGELLTQARQWRVALTAFQRAAALRPDEVTAVNNAAWLLGTCPDPQVRNGAQALAWAERACRMSGRGQPSPLRSLAAAYAEMGQYAEAVQAAEAALLLAERAGRAALVGAIQEQIALHRQGQPYRMRE